MNRLDQVFRRGLPKQGTEVVQLLRAIPVAPRERLEGKQVPRSCHGDRDHGESEATQPTEEGLGRLPEGRLEEIHRVRGRAIGRP